MRLLARILHRSHVGAFCLFSYRYVDIGDSIALQYGGSEAHKKVTAGKTESNIMPIGKVRKLGRSVFRLLHCACAFLRYYCFHFFLAAQRTLDVHSPIL